MAAGDPSTTNQPSNQTGVGPQGPAPQGVPARHIHEMNVAAYVQMSFHDEIELSGHIGGIPFNASSASSVRGIKVEGTIGTESAHLNVKARRLRPMTASGEVMGQPVTGRVTATGSTVQFEGMAGEEPLHYELSALGPCTNHNADLGVQVVYQAIYSELVGSVDRVPDAVMLCFLLPVALVKWEAAYS